MSIQERFLEAMELYRQALNALRHNQESGGLEGGDKLRFTKQLIKSKNELQNLSSDLVKHLRPEAAELVLELIEYTTQSVWLDQRFYDLHPKVNAIVKASAVAARGDNNHWVSLAQQSGKKYRRQRAKDVFDSLDGKEQRELLSEFKECKNYRGKEYETSMEAVIAKIMRVLESKKV